MFYVEKVFVLTCAARGEELSRRGSFKESPLAEAPSADVPPTWHGVLTEAVTLAKVLIPRSRCMIF